MKKIICILVLSFLFVSSAYAVWVRGYTRRDGTYVRGHYRSSPNRSRSDNYGPSQTSLDRINPWRRDYDSDGIPNMYDSDDDNDGVIDDYDSSQYNSNRW